MGIDLIGVTKKCAVKGRVLMSTIQQESSLGLVKATKLPQMDISICEPDYNAADWGGEHRNVNISGLILEGFDFGQLYGGNIAGGEAA